jgi:protein SOK2
LQAGSQARLSLDSSASQEYSIQQNPVSESYYPNQTQMTSMNQPQPYMDVHSHLSSGQPYASHPATAGAIHYQYPQQPPVLQPTSTYGPASSYSPYPYPNGVPSSQSAPQAPATSMGSQVPAQLLPLPGKFRASCSMR